jgi:hypothetical protein
LKRLQGMWRRESRSTVESVRNGISF